LCTYTEFLVHAVAVVLTSVLVVSSCVAPPFLFHFIYFILFLRLLSLFMYETLLCII
jgi:hypothetical protein